MNILEMIAFHVRIREYPAQIPENTALWFDKKATNRLVDFTLSDVNTIMMQVPCIPAVSSWVGGMANDAWGIQEITRYDVLEFFCKYRPDMESLHDEYVYERMKLN